MSDEEKPKPVRVVACIIEQDGKFLITKRMKHSHLGHLWEFPGGKVENGETLEACAVRECLEEIDVKVRPLQVIQEVVHHYDSLSVHLFFMTCRLVRGIPRPLECADLAWAAPEEFSRYEFPEADRAVIAQHIQKSRNSN